MTNSPAKSAHHSPGINEAFIRDVVSSESLVMRDESTAAEIMRLAARSDLLNLYLNGLHPQRIVAEVGHAASIRSTTQLPGLERVSLLGSSWSALPSLQGRESLYFPTESMIECDSGFRIFEPSGEDYAEAIVVKGHTAETEPASKASIYLHYLMISVLAMVIVIALLGFRVLQVL